MSVDETPSEWLLADFETKHADYRVDRYSPTNHVRRMVDLIDEHPGGCAVRSAGHPCMYWATPARWPEPRPGTTLPRHGDRPEFVAMLEDGVLV